MFYVRSDPEMLDLIERLCEKTHRTRSNLVRYLILKAAETGLPELVTEKELQERMDRKAVQPLVDEVGNV